MAYIVLNACAHKEIINTNVLYKIAIVGMKIMTRNAYFYEC